MGLLRRVLAVLLGVLALGGLLSYANRDVDNYTPAAALIDLGLPLLLAVLAFLAWPKGKPRVGEQ